jgi:hypothetical protein
MLEQVLLISVPLLIFALAVYGVGLRPSRYRPFLRLAAPAGIFAWTVHAAARNRLRRTETIRDWFVYREGNDPGPQDLARVQMQFIAGFSVLLVVHLIAS